MIQRSQPSQVSFDLDVKAAFENLTYEDRWDDAQLREALIYVRGSKLLSIPQSWRALVPRVF